MWPQMANKHAHWSKATTKTFLDLCIAEKNILNFNTKGLTTVGWNILKGKFRQQRGVTYDGRQLHSKLAGLRRIYTRWHDLQHKTGLGRNRNGGIAADDSYWRTEEGDTCDVEPTCGNPPPFLEELEILFGKNTQDKLSKRPIGEQIVDSPPKKKSASIEDCLRDISEAVTRHSRKSNNYDVAKHNQVRQILEADGIPEGSELHLRAMYLCRNAVSRMELIEMRTKEGRKR
ncbi:hypothetical protein U9M48_040709 [Paspalum notatum var. saurae]|uniref:Myb/SANT-like domain-containing protein n=1 Tax=Paspalum notatum var. saurae TaxID=547442 RepID=A0AAQ3XDI1_PASNO